MSSIARSITLTLNRQLREKISQINYKSKQINNINCHVNNTLYAGTPMTKNYIRLLRNND